MCEFTAALISKERSHKIPEEFDYFGQFIGEWDIEWIDNRGTEKERHVKGEWIFSWVLEGTAIQDLFICPSRDERLLNPQPDAEYGTTIRIYNPEKKSWDVFYGCRGSVNLLESAKVDDCIVLNCTSIKGENRKMKWVFSEITDTSFHWSNMVSLDCGETWSVKGELYGVRRK